MNQTNPTVTAGNELRRSTAQQYADGLAGLCRSHYRTAERIVSDQLWRHAVTNAAEAVGAGHVPYLVLIQRAREILLRGPLYTIRRDGRVTTFGASLVDDGAYVPLCSRADDGTEGA